tara:strand:- start:2364 stop:2834 length:471 start_codon:yes stop_codon:yes gene_type:complete
MLQLTTMATLLDLSWIIPAAPLGGAIAIAVLLVSFTKTINRLTKPISLFLIACVSLSIILSLLFLLKHISGQSINFDFDIANITLNIAFVVNELVEKSLIIIGSIFLFSMIFSYYILDRQKGYVRYMASLSFLCSLTFLGVLNSDSFGFIIKSLNL